jgi:two-component system, LytTR family, sensor kinase
MSASTGSALRQHAGAESRDLSGGASGRDSALSSELHGRPVLLNVVFWTLFGVLQASNWLLSTTPVQFAYTGRVLGSALTNAYIWALLTPVIFRVAASLNPERGAQFRRVVSVVALGLGVGAITAVLAGNVHRVLHLSPADGSPRILGIRLPALARWYFQEVVTFFFVLVAGITFEMWRRYRAREREAAQLQSQASQLQAQLAEARLAVLRTRLNPHFLFNTLNAVSALVAKDPRGVRNMIALLSELLRYAITDSKEQEIPLRQEVSLLRLYLEILEIRYQGQLQTAVTLDADAPEALVPNLILQPLVENAMKHGIDRAGGHGTIEVSAHRSGEYLVLAVRDTGPERESFAAASETGVGLQLTRDRLAALYGEEHRLELEPVSSGGMIARIVLPYHTSEDVRFAEELTPP